MNLRRRMRASTGQLSLVALLTFLAGMLVVGAPRVANQLTDEALRIEVGSVEWTVRDVTFTAPVSNALKPAEVPVRLNNQTKDLPAAVRDRLETVWWSMTTVMEGSAPLDERGIPLNSEYSLRAGSGQFEAVRLVRGRLPHSDTHRAYASDAQVVEVVLTDTNALRLRQDVGAQFLLAGGEVRVVVVGIVAPLDADDPIWRPMPLATTAYLPKEDGERFLATYLTDLTGISQAFLRNVKMDYQFRYRLDAQALTMAAGPQLIDAVQKIREDTPRASLTTGFDTLLSRFADEVRAGQALLAMVRTGTLATLAGLVLLAAQLAVRRRHGEFALLRARGAALSRLGWLVLSESLLVVPVAAVAGAVIGSLPRGRPGDDGLALLGFAVVALAATAVLAMLGQRRLSFAAAREDAPTGQVGLRRRTAELSVVVLAVAGIWLLRQRGISPTDGVDVFLVSVPVLFAAGAAVMAMRAIPAPLGWLARLAAQGRGTIAFLGLARAGRAAATIIAPVAVLVVAVSTATFSIAVATTIDTGRDRATDHQVPADALLVGDNPFDPQTTTRLRAVTGVTAVAPYLVQNQANLRASRAPGSRLSQVYLVVLDGETFARINAAAGRNTGLPAALTTGGQAPAQGGSTPALVSPLVAADLAGAGSGGFDLQGIEYDFTVAQVVERFPTVPADAKRFVVLPWQALPVPAERPLQPTGFLIGGPDGLTDLNLLTEIGNAGQLRWVSTVNQPAADFVPRTTVTTWTAYRAGLEEAGINGVLSFAYGVGAAGGLALALLAVGFAVLAGARARGKVLSRLRTMGLTRPQGQRLLLVEIAPVLTVAVITGAAVGAALPFLITPALRLSTYTAGWDVAARLDPLVILGTIGLVLAGLMIAVVVETIFHRRQRLGEVLRLGEES